MYPLTCPDCGDTRLVNHQTRWAAEQRDVPGRCYACGIRSRKAASRLRAQAVISSGEKWCRGCQQSLPHDLFYRARKHLDGLASYCKECDKQQIAAWYSDNKSRVIARATEWNRANPIARRSIVHNCYGRRKDPEADLVDHATILEQHGWVCHICGDDIQGLDDLDFDHVIPFVRGGTHTTDNVRPSHSLCNARKGQSEMARCG